MSLLLGVVSACSGDDDPNEQGAAGMGASANASGTSGGGAGGKSGGGASGADTVGGTAAGTPSGASGGQPSGESGGGGEASGQAGDTSGEGGQMAVGGEGGQAGAGSLTSLEVTPEEGGTVTLGDVVVEVLPGAVTQPVTITLELVDLSALAPLPGDARAIGPAVALLPHGLTFSVPVSITLPHSGGSGGELDVVRLDDEADQSWGDVADPLFTATDVTFDTSTFSIVVALEEAAPGDVIHLHYLERGGLADVGSSANAVAAAFDNQDNLLVGGRIGVTGELADGYVTKLGPDDTKPMLDRRLNWKQLWSHRITGAPANPPNNNNRDDHVSSIAVDKLGSMLVAGGTYGAVAAPNSAGAHDAFVRKLTPIGAEQWTRQWGGDPAEPLDNDHNDTATGVAVDSSNNVLISGTLDFQGSIWIGDAYVRKLDSAGALVWQTVFTVDSPAHDYGTAVAVGPSDHVLLLGSTLGDIDGPNAGKIDYFVSKLDATSGLPLWTEQYGTVEDDCAQALAVDSSGDVLVAGQTGACTDGAYPGLVAFVVKLDGDDGSVIWKHEVTTPTGEQRATAIAVDAANNVLVAGHSTGSFDGDKNLNAGSIDVFVRKLSSSGTVLWTNLFGNSRIQRAYSVVVDSTGLVAVVGSTQDDLEAPTPGTTFEPFVAWLLP